MSDTVQTKVTLKSWFETGDKPTESQFDDFITTMRARDEDVDLENNDMRLTANVQSDLTSSGIIAANVSVDTNAQGIGAPLYMGSDGNYDTANAASSATMPCIALALDTGTGSANKSVLHYGYMRNDAWNWTVGGQVYVANSTGTLSQTSPAATGDQVQVIGIATDADIILFNPNATLVEIS